MSAIHGYLITTPQTVSLLEGGRWIIRLRKRTALQVWKEALKLTGFTRLFPTINEARNRCLGKKLNSPASWRRYYCIHRVPLQVMHRTPGLQLSWISTHPGWVGGWVGGLFNDSVPLSPCTCKQLLPNTPWRNSNELIVSPSWPLEHHFFGLFWVFYLE